MNQPSAARLLWSEGPAVFELGAFGLAFPLFRFLPKGDGHPVLVLPGLTTSDNATIPMRSVLKRLGYGSHGWKLGVNRGPDDATRRGLQLRLEDLSRRYEEPVSVIGWSLGGVYARELARRNPHLVRLVITLGSPFRAVERDRGLGPPPVSTSALFSKQDAVVPWQMAIDESGNGRENIEVYGTHSGLGHNPAVIVAVADRLAQPRNSWAPFQPHPRVRYLFPKTDVLE